MSTLIKDSCSPTKVLRVSADFSRGLPYVSTVFVGTRCHSVQVVRTTAGLAGKCSCQEDCGAALDAVEALRLLAHAWERPPFSRARARIEGSLRSDLEAEPLRLGIRPYDGLARDVCEADLLPLDVPPWAYDGQNVRFAIADAEIAHDIWHELQDRLDSLFGGRTNRQSGAHHSIRELYQASWEPDRGLMRGALGSDLVFVVDEDGPFDLSGA